MRGNTKWGRLFLGMAVWTWTAVAADREQSAEPVSPGVSSETAIGASEARLSIELTPALDADRKGAGQTGLLSVDISGIPLKTVLSHLGTTIGAEVFVAEGLGEEPITIAFRELPVAKGIKHILGERNYMLVHRPTEAGPREGDEMQIAEIRVTGQRAGTTTRRRDPIAIARSTEGQEALAQEALAADRPEDRVRALERFAKNAEPLALADVLIHALQDPDVSVRALAVQRMTDAANRGLESLAEVALRDANEGLRTSAIGVMMSIHGVAAKPVLEQALSDPSPAVRDAARQGVEFIQKLARIARHRSRMNGEAL